MNVGDDVLHKCRMCSVEFSQVGYKCTVCLATYYCIECRKLDAEIKVDDNVNQSVVNESFAEQSLRDAMRSEAGEEEDSDLEMIEEERWRGPPTGTELDPLVQQ